MEMLASFLASRNPLPYPSVSCLVASPSLQSLLYTFYEPSVTTASTISPPEPSSMTGVLNLGSMDGFLGILEDQISQ